MAKYLCKLRYLVCYCITYIVEENTENVFNPMHDAAKRGNSELIEECLQNNVSSEQFDDRIHFFEEKILKVNFIS